MYRLSYRNFGSHQTLLFNHTVAADGDPSHRHSGIRWYELRSSKAAPWFIYQQGTYAPDENDRWIGSIAMDRHGDIALGFDVSGANQYPSQAFLFAAHDMDGGEFAALDTLQYGLARDAARAHCQSIANLAPRK